MRYLFKKMLKDLWAFKVQFVAVLIMSLVSVVIYVGIEGLWYSMQSDAESWLEDTLTADAWVYGSEIDSEDINDVEKLDGINSVQGVISIDSTLKIPNDHGQLLLIAPENTELSKLTIIKGDEYNPNTQGIWVYEFFADNLNIVVGDTITVKYENITHEMEVKGIVQSAEYLYYSGSSTTLLPDRYKYGYAYISAEDMETLRDGNSTFNQMRLELSNSEMTSDEKEELRSDIESVLGTKYGGLQDRSDFRGISVAMDMSESFESMSVMFSVVFILLSLLTINTTMKRMVQTQRTQVGTLKALGFSNAAIRIHYSLYGLITSVLGSIIGYLLAPILANMLIDIELDYYYIYEWTCKNTWISYALIGAIILCCTITALLACGKGIKGMPAETMRNEPPKFKGKIFIENSQVFWESLSYEWKWALRGTFNNKGRTFIGIISVAGSLMLLMAGLGMRDSLSHANDVVYGEQYDYGSKILFNRIASLDDLNNAFEDTNNDGQWVQEGTIELRTSKNYVNTTIQIYDIGYFTHLENMDGELTTLPDEGIAVSNYFASEHNLRVGDTVQFRLNGYENYSSAVVNEILNTSTPQGIYLSTTAWEKSGNTFTPNVLLAKSESLADDMKDKSYVDETTTLETQLTSADNVVDNMLPIVLMLILAAVCLSVTILYNLGLLNFNEKYRDYATQKVIGYHDYEIKKVVSRENAIQLVIGLIVGIPIGYIFMGSYISSISTSSFEYMPYISLIDLCISFALVIICSYATILIVSRKIKKLDMISALKSVE